MQESYTIEKNYDESYKNLIIIERYCRNHENVELLLHTVEALMNITKQYKTVKEVNDLFTFLVTRRAQEKQAITKLVNMCMKYINEIKINNDEGYEMLCKTICNLTEGKVFVDNQRAQIVKEFALYLEEKKKYEEASELLKSMHIETFVSLDKREKTEFLLVQLRIALKCNDYLQAQLLSNKINPNIIREKGFEELRIEYYRLMLKYYIQNKNYLECCRSLLTIHDTINEASSELKMEISQNEFFREEIYCLNQEIAMKLAIFFIMCTEQVPEKKEFLMRINTIRELENYPPYEMAIQMFLTDELIESQTLLQIFSELYQKECFSHIHIECDIIMKNIRLQIIHHNIRMIAKYYHTITLKRFGELLDITLEELETQICFLVNGKQIYAKIDRPNGFVTFIKTKDPKEVIDQWTDDIKEMLVLVNETCFLIETEKMNHSK